ncbi:unnamed protein product [Hymenolepis diminuta]|uniref:L-lactate dehydrogenase n=2 Tax=Hymenolepis diminuta TaxID=6216 RepID=A0A0R3SSZ2_HYMDI|nr:unnamed protein product [Hymenolepis diminuta]
MEYALDIGNSYINYQGYRPPKEIMSDGRLTFPQEGDSTCLHDTKVTVVGCGSVGSAVAFALVTKGVANTVVIYDIAKDRCEGEVMDMEQGCQFIDSCKVIGGADITTTKDSDIVVITAGARQEVGESRLNLVQRNVDIFKKLIPQLAKESPKAFFVVVANPVDIMTYVTWKFSGFPKNRVMGSGTMLDSARFKHILGKKLHMSPNAVHGFVIGEHGDSSVPVWSSVTVGCARLTDIYPQCGKPNDPDNFAAVHHEVVQSAYEIIRLKGNTAWAIGLCCSALCSSILKNKGEVIPVTTCIKGQFGITGDVFTSVPCVINCHGIGSVIKLDLNEEEKSRLMKSVETLDSIIKGIKW